MNRRFIQNICLAIIFTLTLALSGCFEKENISLYKKTVKRILSEIEAIEAIPAKEKITVIDGRTIQGAVDLNRRIEYYKGRKEEIEKIIKSMDSLITSRQLDVYNDDALFFRAYAYLYISALDHKDDLINDTIAAIGSLVDRNENIVIEEWTKKKMDKIFWDKLAMGFSKSLSEKQNLFQYFLLCNATIYWRQKGDTNNALKYYQKVLQIDLDSLSAQHASIQIKKIESGEKRIGQ